MEFFAEFSAPSTAVESLHQLLTIQSIADFSASIETLLAMKSPSKGEIYSIWGQFEISREEIKNGVRFALIDCPHAFAWTTAIHANAALVTVHCTIDKRNEDPEFTESIANFVQEWSMGVLDKLNAS